MKIKQQYLRIIIITIVITMLCGSYILYNRYIDVAKQRFQSQITMRMQLLLAQQQTILLQLSQNILEPIKNQDTATIVTNIRAYEDVLFKFSKLEIGLPIRIRFVSLSAPQQILGSNGKLSNESLAPDENYYLDIMDNPGMINFSKPYEELAMPGLLLCNWGLGILEQGIDFRGLLDVQISVSALQDYLATNNFQKFKLFSFKLNPNNISQPDILIDARMYRYGLLGIWVAVMLGTLFIGGGLRLIYVFYHKYRHQQHNLAAMLDNLNKLTIDVNLVKSSRQVQYKYGILAANDASMESLIDLQQLVQDAYTVNAEDAVAHNINIVIPSSITSEIRFYGNRLRLMQIISGIISEGINVLPANSTITLQVDILNLQERMQQIIFKFHDNGFYNKLEHRHVLISSTDVRVQGWDNISYLIDLELGELQHLHTTYTGNTISVIITRRFEQKIFNIESYS